MYPEIGPNLIYSDISKNEKRKMPWIYPYILRPVINGNRLHIVMDIFQVWNILGGGGSP